MKNNRRFLKNIEAKVLPYTILLLIILVSFTSIFVMLPPSNKIVNAEPGSSDWSGEYVVVSTTSNSKGFSGMVYKNTTSDYWCFYIDQANKDLFYRHNTTASSLPDFTDDSETQITNANANAYRIGGVMKYGNTMYLFYTINAAGNDPIYRLTWNGAEWISNTLVNNENSNNGPRFDVQEFDDGTNQYWLCFTDDAQDLHIINGTSPTGLGNNTEIDTNIGVEGGDFGTYNNDLYVFYTDGTDSTLMQYRQLSEGWVSEHTLIDHASDSLICPIAHNFTSNDGETLVIGWRNDTESGESLYYKVLNGSGLSSEMYLCSSGSAEDISNKIIDIADENKLVVCWSPKDTYFGFSYVLYNYTPPYEVSVYGIIDSYLDNGYVTWSGEQNTTVFSNETGSTGKNVTFYTDVNISENCTDVFVDLSGDITLGASNEIDFDSSSGNSEMYLQVGIDETWSDEWVQFTDANSYNISLNISWDSLSDDANPFVINNSSGNVTIHCIFKLVLPETISSNTYLTSSSSVWLITWKYETTW